MTLRNQRPLTFRPNTVTDAVDGTNAPQGALYAAINLVPSMHTRNVWVPRPAVTNLFDFGTGGNDARWGAMQWAAGLWGMDASGGGEGELLVEIGNRLWGFVQTTSGKSMPFCYDVTTKQFVTIRGFDMANLPDSTSNTGDWQPPSISQIGAYLVFTHPGFSLPNAFGWIDMTGLSDQTQGDVSASSITVANLHKDALLAGWRPGMRLSGVGIAPNAQIASVSVDGLSLTMTQPAIQSASQTFLSVAGGTPDHPVWSAGNLNAYPLPGIARWVSMFNGRAWYAVKNSIAFSDAGDPLQMTNADQVLSIQNGLDVTCMATMPFANQTLTGGITSALMVFQGDAAIWQITGDQVTQNLALNFTADNGTMAPNTLATVPMNGLWFIAPDGLRQISLNGVLSEPLSDRGDGVALPFVNALHPSRMCAAYNEDVYRVSVTNYVATGGTPVASLAAGEYWFHVKLKAWSGPHTCPARLITPSDQEGAGHGFVMFRLPPQMPALGSGRTLVLGTGGQGILALGTGRAGPPASGVWFSATHPMIDSAYAEDDTQLIWVLQTSLLPDTGDMFIAAMLETSIMLAMPPAGTVSLTALDERGVTISSADINGFFPPGTPQPPPNVWSDTAGGDALVWGSGKWGQDIGGTIVAQRQVDWRATLVFKQTSLVLRGESSGRIAVGNINMRYQRSGYMLIDPARVQELPPGIPNFAA